MIDKRTVFSVSREGFMDWTVMWSSRYSGVIVSHFWTRRAAERCCERLNRFLFDLPLNLQHEDEYEKKLERLAQ